MMHKERQLTKLYVFMVVTVESSLVPKRDLFYVKSKKTKTISRVFRLPIIFSIKSFTSSLFLSVKSPASGEEKVLSLKYFIVVARMVKIDDRKVEYTKVTYRSRHILLLALRFSLFT